MDHVALQVLVWTGIIALCIIELVLIFQRRKCPRTKPLPPGPQPWPVVGNLTDKEALCHQRFAEMSKQYGPLLYLTLGSKPLIVANSIDLAREILKTNDTIFASRPHNTQFVEMAYDHNTMSTSPAGQQWRTLRKIFTGELVSPKRIHTFQGLRKTEMLTSLQVMMKESQGKKTVRVDVRLKDHIANIVTSMIMNKKYFGPEADDKMDSVKFQNMLQAVVDLAGVLHLGDYIPFFHGWDVQGHKKPMREAHSNMDSFLQGIVDERRRQYEKNGGTGADADFLDTLLTHCDEKSEQFLTEKSLKGLLLETIMAGVDTSAATVEWNLAEVLRHPSVLRKAQEELDAVVGRDRLVEESDIPNLPFLKAIVKETYRLHPAATLLLPHASTEACEVGGFHVPANAQVFVNVWAIGRDADLWENPLQFRPERFLDKAIEPLGHHYELLPFGSGRRQCPGSGLAHLTVQFYLAVLIQGCVWTCPPDQAEERIDMSEATGILNHKARPLEAIITPRLPLHVLYPGSY